MANSPTAPLPCDSSSTCGRLYSCTTARRAGSGRGHLALCRAHSDFVTAKSALQSPHQDGAHVCPIQGGKGKAPETGLPPIRGAWTSFQRARSLSPPEETEHVPAGSPTVAGADLGLVGGGPLAGDMRRAVSGGRGGGTHVPGWDEGPGRTSTGCQGLPGFLLAR